MSSLTDDTFKSAIIGMILGAPIVIGITILAIPFGIISLITGVPMIILLQNLAAFVLVLILVGLLSRYQIIENGIVGLIVGVLVYFLLKWHSLAAILIGVGTVVFLFFIAYIKIGFWIKTILFSVFETYIVFVCIYSDTGVSPLPDMIWKVSFCIVFFLENILIRCAVARGKGVLFSENVSLKDRKNKNQEEEKTEPVPGSVVHGEEQLHTFPKIYSPVAGTENQDENSIDYLMNRVYLFSQKKTFWDGSVTDNMEEKVYTILREFIDKEYLILPHVAFREIFWWGEYKSDWRLTDRVTKMHFDFGIYNKELLPILFLEVHGKDHKVDTRVIERDKFKAEIMKHCGMKLVTIDCSEPMADSEVRNKVIACIRNEVPDRQAYAVYCPHCKSLMQIKYSEKTKKYFYGCTTYKATNDVNCPTINILDVPPLYTGIQLSINKRKNV